MKTYGGIDPRILDRGTSWRRVVVPQQIVDQHVTVLLSAEVTSGTDTGQPPHGS
jgi:hypothetical protein